MTGRKSKEGRKYPRLCGRDAVGGERLTQLNQIAITQMQSLVGNASIKKLK